MPHFFLTLRRVHSFRNLFGWGITLSLFCSQMSFAESIRVPAPWPSGLAQTLAPIFAERAAFIDGAKRVAYAAGSPQQAPHAKTLQTKLSWATAQITSLVSDLQTYYGNTAADPVLIVERKFSAALNGSPTATDVGADAVFGALQTAQQIFGSDLKDSIIELFTVEEAAQNAALAKFEAKVKEGLGTLAFVQGAAKTWSGGPPSKSDAILFLDSEIDAMVALAGSARGLVPDLKRRFGTTAVFHYENRASYFRDTVLDKLVDEGIRGTVQARLLSIKSSGSLGNGQCKTDYSGFTTLVSQTEENAKIIQSIIESWASPQNMENATYRPDFLARMGQLLTPISGAGGILDALKAIGKRNLVGEHVNEAPAGSGGTYLFENVNHRQWQWKQFTILQGNYDGKPYGWQTARQLCGSLGLRLPRFYEVLESCREEFFASPVMTELRARVPFAISTATEALSPEGARVITQYGNGFTSAEDIIRRANPELRMAEALQTGNFQVNLTYFGSETTKNLFSGDVFNLLESRSKISKRTWNPVVTVFCTR